MSATKIKSLALGLLVALSGLSACISYDNQDQYCDVLTSPDNLNDACPYGPPGGAKFAQRAGCPSVLPQVDASNLECGGAKSWTTDIWPLIGANCGAAGCHADGAKGITLTAANAKGAFDTLSSYTGASDRPYISNMKPEQAWILCNLTTGAKDGGLTMPPPPLPPLGGDTLGKIATWAKCGQGL